MKRLLQIVAAAAAPFIAVIALAGVGFTPPGGVGGGLPAESPQITGTPNIDGVLEFEEQVSGPAGAAGKVKIFAQATDGLDAYVKLQMHMDGSLQSFADSSGNDHVITAQGDATQSETHYKWTSAAYFDGTDDYLTVANSADFDMGVLDFTIDYWIRLSVGGSAAGTVARDNTNIPGYLIGLTAGGGAHYAYMSSDGVSFDIANGVQIGTLVEGTWSHIAVVRYGNEFYSFQDGAQTANWQSSAALIGSSDPLVIGTSQNSSSGLLGYIDELRISKGIARWTGAFTPPSSPYADGPGPTGLFIQNPSGVAVQVGDAGADWGTIGGSISSQTDLNNALNGKEPEITDSASLRTTLDDETGTGAAVFATAPTVTNGNLVTPDILEGLTLQGAPIRLPAQDGAEGDVLTARGNASIWLPPGATLVDDAGGATGAYISANYAAASPYIPGGMTVSVSLDGATFENVKSVTDESFYRPGGIRDPHIMYYLGRFYVAYSDGLGGGGTSDEIFVGVSDDLIHWSHLVTLDTGLTTPGINVPTWTIDAAGSPYIVFVPDLDHAVRAIYPSTPADPTTWTTPGNWTGPTNLVDGGSNELQQGNTNIFYRSANTTYYMFTRNYGTGDMEMRTSSALLTGWGAASSTGTEAGLDSTEPDGAMLLANGDFRWYHGNAIGGGACGAMICYSESSDQGSTWTNASAATMNGQPDTPSYAQMTYSTDSAVIKLVYNYLNRKMYDSHLEFKTHVDGTLTNRGRVDENGLRMVMPAAQTIAEGDTIVANACGGLKRITAAGSVTTNTTNTFTAPATANEGCCMDVVNTGSNQITLDNNGNFASAGAANVALGQHDSVRVCSDGTTWRQVGDTGNN